MNVEISECGNLARKQSKINYDYHTKTKIYKADKESCYERQRLQGYKKSSDTDKGKC